MGEETVLGSISRPFTGDLEALVQRRVIRALVAPSRTQYWIDRGKQTGAQYDLLTRLEHELNRRYQKAGKHIRLHISFIPTSRDQLIPALLAGRGELGASFRRWPEPAAYPWDDRNWWL